MLLWFLYLFHLLFILTSSVPCCHKYLGTRQTTTHYIRTGFSTGGRFKNLGGHKEIYLKERGLLNDTAKIWMGTCSRWPPCPPAPWGSHDSSLLLFSYLLKLINALVVVIHLCIPSFIHFLPVACLIVISRHWADYHALCQNWVQYWWKVQKSEWAQRNIAIWKKGFCWNLKAYDTAKIWVVTCLHVLQGPPDPLGFS